MAGLNPTITISATDATSGAFDSARRNLSGLKGEAAGLKEGLESSLGKLGTLGGAIAAAVGGASLKGAIDLADSIDDLAEKSGIAAETLSALRYAGETVGTPFESLQGGIRKLSASMADAAGGGKEQQAVFKALGVTYQTTSGQLRSTTDVLGDLADKFSSFKDSPEKAALAMDLFGKSGMEMIPLLNQGAAGIRDLGEEGRKFGVVFGSDVAKAAADFNDNLTRVSESAMGAKVSIAAALLPTMNQLLQAFVDTKKEGSDLASGVGGALKNAIEAVSIAGANVAFVFKGIGNEIGGMVAQLAALARLDFKGFSAIGDAMKEDAARARRELEQLELRILGLRNPAAGAGRGTLPDPRSLGDPGSIASQTQTRAPIVQKPQAAAAEASAYASLNQEVTKRLALMDAEQAQGAKLTETEKANLEFLTKVNDQNTKLSASERERLRTKAELLKVQGVQYDQFLRDIEASKQAREENNKTVDAILKAKDAAGEQLKTQLQQNEAVGLSAVGIAELERVRLSDTASTKEWLAGIYDTIPGQEALAEALRQTAADMRALGDAKVTGAVAQANVDLAKEARTEWKAFTDQLYNGLTDRLYRGFESGKGFFESFADGIKNWFKTTVLRLAIQGTMSLGSVALGISSGMGGAGSGISSEDGGLGLGSGLTLASAAKNLYSAATGAANLLNGGASTYIQSGINYFTGTGGLVSQGPVQVGAFAQGAGAAAGWAGGVLGGIYGGRAISGGYSLNGGTGNSTINLGTAIGSLWGPLGALAGGLIGGAINKAFGRGPKELENSGLRFGVTGDMLSANAYAAFKEEGGWFTSDRRTRTDPALDAAAQSNIDKAFAAHRDPLASAFNTLGLDFGKGVAGFVEQAFDLGLDGLSAEEQAKKVATHFAEVTDRMAQYVANALADQGALNVTLKDGETVTAGYTRIATSLLSVNAVLGQLHQTTLAFSVSGGNAAAQLVELFGSIEAFNTATASYYDHYYSDAEKLDNLRANTTASLAAVGLALPKTEAEFRKLVEAQDKNTEAGRKAFATLISVEGAFHDLTQSAADLATTMRDAAASALDTAEDNLKQAYQAQADQFQATIDSFLSLAYGLAEFRRQLTSGAQAMLSPEAAYAAARQQFAATAAKAQAGDEKALADLQGVGEAFLQASQDYNANSEQYFADLASVKDAVQASETSARATADVAKLQLTALQNLVSPLVDIKTTNLSIRDAILQLVDAATKADAAGVEGAGALAGAAAGSVAGGLLSDVNAYAQANGGDAYYFVPGLNDLAAKMQSWQDIATTTGQTLADVVATTGRTLDEWERIQAIFDSGGVAYAGQRYASGGYYPGGLALVGEQGPELINFGQPGMVYTAAQTANLLGGGGGQGGAIQTTLQSIDARLAAVEAHAAAQVQVAIAAAQESSRDMGANNAQLAAMARTARLQELAR